ncbi:MAG: hypothetical protein WBL11_04455 [Bacteroidales bacterium]|jgi:hypothetical protein|nr:hypothetical protein [Bacteroidales bacterium]MDI9576380.1 hypothetical protein [Bacteroidota bacterium]MDD2593479.1 hypothetical protein [Bacteroidales bacterium]MDD3755428.1 hypothetical protein [Bacteroidales bacterium]MDY0400557.1 hypothetical protein [Bacteroidales bacterium]
MKKNLSQVISIALHPVFIPIWFAIILFNSGYFLNAFLPNAFFKSYIWLLIIIMVIIPTIIILFSYHLGLIESVHSSIPIERIKILLIILVSSFILYFFLKRLHIPIFYLLPIRLTIILTTLLCIFSSFMNVSIHSAGWMNLFTSLYILQYRLIEINIFWIIVIIPILWGLAAQARYVVGKHNRLQIFMGAFLGIITGLSVFMV